MSKLGGTPPKGPPFTSEPRSGGVPHRRKLVARTFGIRDHVRDPGFRFASRMEVRAPHDIYAPALDPARMPGCHVEHHDPALDPARNSGSRASPWIPR